MWRWFVNADAFCHPVVDERESKRSQSRWLRLVLGKHQEVDDLCWRCAMPSWGYPVVLQASNVQDRRKMVGSRGSGTEMVESRQKKRWWW